MLFRSGEDDATSVVIDGQTFAAEASTIITVDTLTDVTDATDGLTSLREALASAVSGDLVTFDSSLRGGTITLGGTELGITNSLTLDGDLNDDGIPDITIDGNGTSRVFNVNDSNGSVDQDVVLEGLIITGANASGNGGGILNRESVTLRNSTLSGNTANRGGAIYNRTATLIINNSTLSGNSATDVTAGGGAILNNGSTASISNSTISGNSGSRGGGFYNYNSTLTLNNSTISGNSAVSGCGGGYSIRAVGTLSLNNSTFSANSTSSSCSGIYNFVSNANIITSTITGNSAAKPCG